MPRYEVEIELRITARVTVEADSNNEARALVYDRSKVTYSLVDTPADKFEVTEDCLVALVVTQCDLERD